MTDLYTNIIMFSKLTDLFKSKSSSPITTDTQVTDTTPTSNYKDLFANMSVDELKSIHSGTPICTDCNTIQELKDILHDTTNVEQIRFLIEDLNVSTNLDMKLDVAIEDGNQPLVSYLISKGVRYSRYSKQMALINKNYKTALYAETYGKERSSIGIDAVHKKYTKSGIVWDESIPEEYRY